MSARRSSLSSSSPTIAIVNVGLPLYRLCSTLVLANLVYRDIFWHNFKEINTQVGWTWRTWIWELAHMKKDQTWGTSTGLLNARRFLPGKCIPIESLFASCTQIKLHLTDIYFQVFVSWTSWRPRCRCPRREKSTSSNARTVIIHTGKEPRLRLLMLYVAVS